LAIFNLPDFPAGDYSHWQWVIKKKRLDVKGCLMRELMCFFGKKFRRENWAEIWNSVSLFLCTCSRNMIPAI
jgi:hypothetical protein